MVKKKEKKMFTFNYSRQHVFAARTQTTVLVRLMEKKLWGKSENEISPGRILRKK